jgi:hypothetical protein
MYPAVVAAAMVLLAAAGVARSAGDGQGDQELRPIIAQLYAAPRDFAGRRIVIYGLVVESSTSGAEFMLQDVSQHPLRIVGAGALTAAVGDQAMVIGTFRDDPDAPYVAADALIATKVLGGGGCC